MPSPITIMRSTAAEALALAVSDLFPGVALVAGGATEVGFWYDFEMPQAIGQEMLPVIEECMRGVVEEGVEIELMHMMRENAMEFFRFHKQPFKVDALSCSSDNIVHVFKVGAFYDLCPAPFAKNMSEAGFFKLLSLEQTKRSHCRITGTSFSSKPELKEFLKRRESAKKRDHMLLGQEMNLFVALDEVGVDGTWQWLPKGTKLRELLTVWWQKECSLHGYQAIQTTQIACPQFLKKIKASSDGVPIFTLEDVECSFVNNSGAMHASLFKNLNYGVKDLPVRYSELKPLYFGGEADKLEGLLRTRVSLADSGHVFCTPKQIIEEIISSLQFFRKTVNIFGFEYRSILRVRHPKFTGAKETWDKSVDWLVQALKSINLDYTIDKEGEAFFGPCFEMRLSDALGRHWKGPSLTIDLMHPEQLKLRYRDSDGTLQTPVMLSRSIFGSLERFAALLLEQYAGNLPLWLTPEQVRVIPLNDKYAAYASKVHEKLISAGIRCGIDHRDRSLGERVHAATSEKVPYMLIVGDNEEKGDTVTIRSCTQETKKSGVKLESFLLFLQEEIESSTSPQKGDRKSVES